jgi:23S rRNA (cytidine1920-2'-O)/16S rRNA (cytidine1409-2'-O)-methyltransferase
MSTRTALRLDEAVAAQAGITRSRARSIIMAGRVRVDGRPVSKPGVSVATSAALEIARASPYVSRGGEKLEAALAAFDLDVRGSTGGFTDCLLAHGAAHVVALDVGYGQLAYALRTDPRVTVVERCNFRLAADDAFGAEFDLVTIDVSFISVVTMIARAVRFIKPGGDIVALVKPQFEAGRERLGGGGVVRDRAVHRAILGETVAAVRTLGVVPVALARSPLRGPAGNVEFFLRVRHDGEPVGADAVDEVLEG